MTEIEVRASVVRWVSDDTPGWVEVSLSDAGGLNHRIIEKVPVITTLPITSATRLPFEVWLQATAELCDPSTGDPLEATLSWNLEATDGTTRLKLLRKDVSYL